MQAHETRQPAEVFLGGLEGERSGDRRKYHILSELARGGMGIVHLAVRLGPQGFHKLVVLKELRPRLPDSDASVAMFMTEARLAARLNHPNIVQTIEVGADHGRCFIAMEYLEGQPLVQLVQRALKRAKRTPLPMHLGILMAVLDALEYAHNLEDFDGTSLGVVHCDVSPHNVFVTYEGQIKLVDFGIAKTTGRGGAARSGILAGKTRYMAPEQAMGVRPDRRTDVFAVGVMLWEAIVGRRPWDGQPDAVVLRSLASGTVPRLRDAWPDIDPRLATIVDRAMSTKPSDRYATALDMRDDLERYIAMRRLIPPAGRLLGTSVSRLFAEERESRRVLIETGIRTLTAKESVDAQPSLVTKPAFASSRRRPSNEMTLWSESAVNAAPSTNTAPSVSLSQPPAESGPSKAWPVVATMGIAALIALATMGMNRIELGNRSAPGVPMAGELAASAPAIRRMKSRVVVVASPPSAQLFLDEVPVPNPYVGESVRDGSDHRLRVEAPGYESKTQKLTVSDDVDLQITLAPTSSALGAQRMSLARQPLGQPGCVPPYVIDSETGKKRWRLECL